jgi:hypothetical protein
MIRHQTVSKDGQTVFFRLFAENLEVESVVRIRKEDVLAIVALVGDMMRAVRYDCSSDTRHDRRLTKKQIQVKKKVTVPLFFSLFSFLFSLSPELHRPTLRRAVSHQPDRPFRVFAGVRFRAFENVDIIPSSPPESKIAKGLF